MKRRNFIQKTAASTALLSMTGIGLSCSRSSATKITILHTNDVHSHVEEFGPNAGQNSNKGGVAKRAALVESVRKENPKTPKPHKYRTKCFRYEFNYLLIPMFFLHFVLLIVCFQTDC